MAKKTTTANYIFSKAQIAGLISDNLILGGNAWDYGFIIMISGLSPEVVTRRDVSLQKAGEVSNLLADEILKRIYRLRFSKKQDELSCYIKGFLADHQRGKLKRFILSRIKNIHEEYILLEDYYNWLVNERVRTLEEDGKA